MAGRHDLAINDLAIFDVFGVLGHEHSLRIVADFANIYLIILCCLRQGHRTVSHETTHTIMAYSTKYLVLILFRFYNCAKVLYYRTMRPIWNGSISFGLVNIPVRMFSAVETREGIHFTMLHKKDKSPINYARICQEEDKEIKWADIVKGYEYKEGEYVVFTTEQLDELASEKSSTIDIQQFAKESEIDIRYFDKPYYLEPVKGGEKAYALLRSALEKSGMLALSKFVMHEREHLAAIKPVGRALVLTQMRFPTDLRSSKDLSFPTDKDVTERELEVALKLIKQETKPFIAEDYHDTYTEELEEIIKASIKGKKPAKTKKTVEKQTTADDLMSALKASLGKK